LPQLPLIRAIGLSSVLGPLLLLAVPALAAPADPAPVAGTTAASTTSANNAAGATPQPHVGYPTTREMWRYCPRDGSHQCVELDIPGVTVPDQAAGTPADPARTAQ